MYLSGTLKTKTVNFYKEQMTDFGSDYFGFGFNMLASDGSLTKLPFEQDELESKLAARQETLISQGIKNTKALAKDIGVNIPLLQKEIDALFSSHRIFAFALFECLYKIIKNTKNKNNLRTRLKQFQGFRQYIDSIKYSLNQVDLDIMIELFLAGLDYYPYEVAKRKEEVFKVGDINSEQHDVKEIISLGEFIAPKRVAIVANVLKEDKSICKYVAPIYFALKSDDDAKKFFNACAREPFFNSESCYDNPTEIYKQAKACGVPDNLREMVLSRKL